MDSGQHEHRAGGVDAHRPVERVGARQDLAAAYGLKWRMGVKTINDQTEDGDGRHAPTKAPQAVGEGPEGSSQENAEPAQRFNEPTSHELEKGIQATRHCCHTPIAEPDRLDGNSLAMLCGEAVGQLWRSVAAADEGCGPVMYASAQTQNDSARRFAASLLPPESMENTSKIEPLSAPQHRTSRRKTWRGFRQRRRGGPGGR